MNTTQEEAKFCSAEYLGEALVHDLGSDFTLNEALQRLTQERVSDSVRELCAYLLKEVVRQREARRGQGEALEEIKDLLKRMEENKDDHPYGERADLAVERAREDWGV